MHRLGYHSIHTPHGTGWLPEGANLPKSGFIDPAESAPRPPSTSTEEIERAVERAVTRAMAKARIAISNGDGK